MDALASVESRWLEDPYILSCEMTVGNQISLFGFKRFIFVVTLIFYLAIAIVKTAVSMVLQQFENLLKQLKFCLEPLKVYFAIV